MDLSRFFEKNRLEWHDSVGEGWSDDLGIIAPDNTWIPWHPAGWYLTNYTPEVARWCLKHLESCEQLHHLASGAIIVRDEKDVVQFRLMWS